LRIQGLFSGYTSGRIDTLKIKITSGTGFINKNAYQDSLMLIMKKTCPIVMADFAGDYEIEEDVWADYKPGDIIPLTVRGDTIMFNYLTSPSLPIKILVNTASGVTSVAKQSYGRYGNTEVLAESVPGSSDNFVDPCDLIVSVELNHTSPGGSDHGNYVIRMRKL